MRTRPETNRIIAHHSLSGDVDVDTIRDWHTTRGFSDIGYHFVIRYDGTIERGRPLHLRGAHAFGENCDSIGICLAGDFSKHAPTEAQYMSLLQLQKALGVIYGGYLHIEYHHELCPGALFDRDYLTLIEEYSHV